MWPRAWEERAGSVFQAAMSHVGGHLHPSCLLTPQGGLDAAVGWCRAELDVCCNPTHSGQVGYCTWQQQFCVVGLHCKVLALGGLQGWPL